MDKWPNFFIVGIDKAGTTSLYHYLKKIPGVYMSPKKEPWYFAPVIRSRRDYPGKVDNEKNYLNLFKDVKDESAIGEASPVYWRDPKAPSLIHEKVPLAKIIISLRDPVERLFSGYLMNMRTKLSYTSFNELVKNRLDPNNEDVIKPPFYYENIKRFFDTFDRNQIKIIIFEEWIKKPQETVEEILSFLGINYTINDFENEAHNTSVKGNPRGKIAQFILRSKVSHKFAQNLIPVTFKDHINKNILLGKEKPKPKMSEQGKEFLINYYREDVRKLEILLGRKLPWPNFTVKQVSKNV